METEPTPPKVPRQRSPSYPAFDLETALERAQQLVDMAGSHGVPIPAALEAWGFSTKSSNGPLTIAALKRFELANDEGKRGARSVVLTPLGHELVIYDRGSDQWDARVKRAALAPSIHADLWSKYDGNLPSDAVIRPYLMIDRGFSEAAARELLREFRSTIDFAGLTSEDAVATLSGNDGDGSKDSFLDSMTSAPTITSPKGEPPVQREASPVAPVQAQQRTIQVPYSPEGWALLQAKFPMTEAEWTQMVAVLEVMKSSLVVNDD